jgi:hypothetical protein
MKLMKQNKGWRSLGRLFFFINLLPTSLLYISILLTHAHIYTHTIYLAGHGEDHVGAGVLVPARYVIHLVLDLPIHVKGLGFRFF